MVVATPLSRGMFSQNWKLPKPHSLKYFLTYFIATLSFIASAFSQTPIYERTVCGYKVTTVVTYNSPNPGQTTFTWTVQNTNPGNGDNGTFQDLSHWSQKFDVCVNPENHVSGGSYGPDPSQNCLGGNLLKFNEGTDGSTVKVYSAVFDGLNYAPVLVDAVFKGATCCTGQIFGVGCCVVDPGEISGTNPVCIGGDPGVLGSLEDPSGNGTVTYQWQSSTTSCSAGFDNIPGATNLTYDPPANATVTTYYRRVATNTLTAGGATCSENSNCVTVTVNPLPTVNAVDKEVCVGQSVALEGTPVGGNWSSTEAPGAISGSTFNATGLAPGSYTVIYSYTDGNGCPNSDEAEVEVVALPEAYTLTALDYCVGDAGLGRITLANSQTGVSYQLQKQNGATWDNVGNPETGSTGNPIVWNTVAAGTYQVLATGAAPTSCTSISGPATIDEVNAPATFTLTGSSYCAGNAALGTITLADSENGVSYQLQDANGDDVQAAKIGDGNELIWTGIAAGTGYKVIATSGSAEGCTTEIGPANVLAVDPPGNFTLTGSSYCSGNAALGTITLADSENGISYQLKDGNGVNVGDPKIGDGNELIWTGIAAGTGYKVVATGAAPTTCNSESGPVNVVLNNNPTVNPSSEVACVGNVSTATISANATGGTGTYTYVWTVPGGVANPGNVASFTATVAGTYSVEVSDGNCAGSGSVTPVFGTCITYTGCTPGYWKNHLEAWGCGYTKTTNFFTAFGIATSPVTNLRKLKPNMTMLQAVSLQGGGYMALARHATSALLNACHQNVSYPYTMGEIITATKEMFINGSTILKGVLYTNAEQLKNEFDRANNQNCPLNNQNSAPGTNNLSSTQLAMNRAKDGESVSELKVAASPNPFTDQVRFVIESPVSGRGNLEVFNLLGQKVQTVFEGQVNAGKGQVIEYRVPQSLGTNLIYVMRVGSHRVTGKLIRKQ